MITFGLVALFARPTPFGLLPIGYMAVIVVSSLIIDSILDNVLRPKVMGNALQVHPAAVIVSALIGSQLLGLLGVILATPVYATAKLVVNYILRKLTDQDPWEGIAYTKPGNKSFLFRWLRLLWNKVSEWLKTVWERLSAWWQARFNAKGAATTPVRPKKTNQKTD